MQKEPGSFFDKLLNNPLFTTDEKIDKPKTIDLTSLNNGTGFIQTFKDDNKFSDKKKHKKRNLEPKLKKKIATLKFKNKFLTKTNFYQDDINIERVEMQVEEHAQLIQENQEKKNYTFTQNIDVNLQLKEQQEKEQKEKLLQNTFFQLSRNISTQKDKGLDIELTDEEIYDKSKIYENTNNFIKKINENKFDLNDRLQNSKRKSPKKLYNREEMKKQIFKKIRDKKNVTLKDPEILKRFFVKKSYVEMQEEKDRKKKEKEQQEEEFDPDFDQQDQDEISDDEEALLLQMEQESQENKQVEQDGGTEYLQQNNDDLQVQQISQGEEQEINQEKLQKEVQSMLENNSQNDQLEIQENQNQMEIEYEKSQDNLSQEENEKNQRQFKNIKKIKDYKNEVKEQKKIINQKKREQFQQAQKQIQEKYYDVEADLGSDNEEHDFVVKKINKNDIEEQEEGLDITDEELVDQNEIEYDNQNEFEAHRQYLENMIADDEQKIKEIMDKNFSGNFYEDAEDIDDRKERLRKNKEFFEILMQNNPNNIEKKLQEEDKQNKMNLYGIEVDQSELEPDSKKKNKITLEQFKRYMDRLTQKYQEREMRKKKNFFQNSSSKFTLQDQIVNHQNPQIKDIRSFSILQSREHFNDSKTIKNNRVSN